MTEPTEAQIKKACEKANALIRTIVPPNMLTKISVDPKTSYIDDAFVRLVMEHEAFRQQVSEAMRDIAPIVRYHETGGHEGDGSDHALRKALLAMEPFIPTPTPTPEQVLAGVEPSDWWKPDPEDPFWMLEVRQGYTDAGQWLKNNHTRLTTSEPAKALRYPSRWHADNARRGLPLCDNGRFKPTEHTWISHHVAPIKGEG